MRGEELIFQYFPNLTPQQRSQFGALQGLYEHWNAKINVISRQDLVNLYERHVLHSLAVARCGLIRDGHTVIDVGCGGGFPSIPLAILMPEVRFTAVDSIGKKIRVVQEVVSALGLKNITTQNCRVESVDEKFDWVVSRAVTRLSEFMEWVDGRYRCGVLYLKGGELEDEILAVGGVSKFFSVSEWFEGEFFKSKKLLFLDKRC